MRFSLLFVLSNHRITIPTVSKYEKALDIFPTMRYNMYITLQATKKDEVCYGKEQ